MTNKNVKKSTYKWTRPEYADFLRSGKKPRTTEEIQSKSKSLLSDSDDGPSKGNYWG